MKNKNIFNQINEENSNLKWILLSVIITTCFLIRFFQIPYDLPLTLDSLTYFFYASDIVFINELPINYTPINNGWSIFLSTFFSVITLENTIEYMNLQRIISVVCSTITCIPIFYVCKKYLGTLFGLFGALIFAVEPRIILNSLLGLTEPLFLLLISLGFALFVNTKFKLTIISFTIITLATLVRGEGVLLLIAFFIIYILKNKKDNKLIPKTVLILSLIFLIMLPISLYRIDILGTDGMFFRLSSSTNDLAESTEYRSSYLENGFKNFPQYFGWILIPIFIIFGFVGILNILQNRNFSAFEIIFPLILISLSAVHSTAVSLQETRFFLPMYPFLIVVSCFGIKSIVSRFYYKKFIILAMILVIIISSCIFGYYKNTNFEHEFESYLISKEILTDNKKLNDLYPELSYLEPSDLPEKWNDFGKLFDAERNNLSIRENVNHNFQIFGYKQFDNLDEFIENYRKDGLSHIIVDDKSSRELMINDIYHHEEKYPFLNKIYDSNDYRLNYKIKIFEIDWTQFEE